PHCDRVSFYYTARYRYYFLSLHDALPIYEALCYRESTFNIVKHQAKGIVLLPDLLDEHFLQFVMGSRLRCGHDEIKKMLIEQIRSEEHTSELQSRFDIVCRLLLEKKKN